MVHGGGEVLRARRDLDVHAQVVARHGRGLEAREAHGVLLGRDQRVGVEVGRLVEREDDFGGIVAVVVGVALAPDHARAELAKGILEALRNGDAGERGERLALQPVERQLLAAPHVLQETRRVAALDDLGGLVVRR